MTSRSLFRTVFVGLCVASGAIVACSHGNKNVAQPPLGQSSAEGPANNDAPPPDASGPLKPADVGEGVPGAMIEHHAETRVAQVTPPTNPSNPTQPNRPGPGSGIGSGIGSGSNPRPVPGPGSGSGSGPGNPAPGQPRPTPPGTPTPGQPVPTPPVTQPTR